MTLQSVEGTNFHAHRLVVAAASEPLAAILRDQFGNMESCAQLSKRTLDVVMVMDDEEDIMNLSKIGGRNVSVIDIIEKGIA